MARTVIQRTVVTIDPIDDIVVEFTPVVNTTEVKQPAVSVSGVDQTVVFRPVE